MVTIIDNQRERLVEELSRVEENGKAEIINGEIVVMPPTGGIPSYVSGLIYRKLHEYSQQMEQGFAFPNNVGYIVRLPNRGSLSPDASYFTGDRIGAGFVEGAPIFAAEVRGERDFGPRAEERMRAKIANYFAAGTLVVWDVDILREMVIRVYRADDPDGPQIFCKGDIANAEPALPGWTLPVNDLLILHTSKRIILNTGSYA